MKLDSKWLAAALLVAGAIISTSSLKAQTVTGTPYMSNIDPNDPSYSGNWATTATITSTPTGLEFNAAGGAGTFSTMYYSIPLSQQTTLNPLDTQVTFNFNWNSGNAVAGVNVLFALDDSMGGVNYYATGYNIPTAGLNSYTFSLQSANLDNIEAGALINGINFQIDPGNVSGNYDITYSSLTLSPTATPEPTSMALAGLGIAGLLVSRRLK